MEWADEAIVLGLRRHGERSVIVEAMTERHGRHFGLVRGGRDRRLAGTLQPGNRIAVAWRARLEEHLGAFAVEPVDLHAARTIADGRQIYAIGAMTALARLLPEREPHPGLYEALGVVLGGLDDPLTAAALMIRLELQILGELGFGLDLSSCAATGSRADLAYVSPRSGRAVSRAAAAPYVERLLPLPGFLGPQPGDAVRRDAPDIAAIRDGFRLTGHFLARDVLGPRGLAVGEAREGFIAATLRALDEGAAARTEPTGS
jgi:DNA repair protein RecO (recombination protein O)